MAGGSFHLSTTRKRKKKISQDNLCQFLERMANYGVLEDECLVHLIAPDFSLQDDCHDCQGGDLTEQQGVP